MAAHESDLRVRRLLEAESELEQLAAQLDVPVEQSEYPMAVLALAHRARALFLSFVYALDGPAPAAALSLLRPAVEINLVLRFLGKNPELHVGLWSAEGQRQILAFLDDFEGDANLQERWGAPPFEPEFKERLRRDVREARGKAHAAGTAGVGKTGAVFPGARSIVDSLEDPGAKEAYTLAYRLLGADVHAGTFAFSKADFTTLGDGRVSFSEPSDTESFLPSRTLSLTIFASTLCIVASVLGLPVAEKADEIKRRFVLDLPLGER